LNLVALTGVHDEFGLDVDRRQGREGFGGATMNLHREAVRAGVQIETHSAVDLDLPVDAGPEVVGGATGAQNRTTRRSS
jgi:hypothetical protein